MARHGPIDDGVWAAELDAYVVDRGPPLRLHGYDVHGDLARHYDFAEIALLALRGVAPDTNEGRAFGLALTWLAPTSIADAPSHATALAQMLGAPPANTVAIAAMGLAHQAQALVDMHAAWLAWLEAPLGEPPAESLAGTDEDRESAAALKSMIGPDVCPLLARIEPSTHAVAIAVLHACGLKTPEELVAAIVLARLPVVIAEAKRHGAAGLRTYPMGTPPFDYEEDDRG